MYAASKNRESGVFGAQVRARLGMLLISLVLQVTLTIAALAKDAAIALALDALGATLVVIIMLYLGAGMIKNGLPSLLDAPADAVRANKIRRAASKLIGEENLVAVRTRRSGETTFVEVALSVVALPTTQALREVTEQLRRELLAEETNLELSVVVEREAASNKLSAGAAIPHSGAN